MKSDVERGEYNYPLCCGEPPIDLFFFFFPPPPSLKTPKNLGNSNNLAIPVRGWSLSDPVHGLLTNTKEQQ